MQGLLLRGALPFTDRLTEGRSVGRFLGGSYLSQLRLNGDPWLVYGRLEAEQPGRRAGFDHRLRTGLEIRREWNSGAGYQFDIATPPQASFNGVQGFDRPRRYDAVPPVATSALYLDDRLLRTLPLGASLDMQAGLRLDVLHRGTTWLSGSRDAVWQPRLNLQITPRSWLRLRGGAGLTTKSPSLASLSPPPQYYDVVNINYFTNNPAERLAVLTTFIRDPTNPALRYSVARKLEGGAEVDLGRSLGTAGVTVFRDRVSHAVGFLSRTDFLLRQHYRLADSMPGSGKPPTLVDPAVSADTVPIVIDQPANDLTLHSSGVELTLATAELPWLRTRVDVQGAWISTRLETSDVDFGSAGRFSTFQVDANRARIPYWNGATRYGQRALVTYRLVHHRAELGLIVTGTVQQALNEVARDLGAHDTLAFAGYVTRTGTLVPVPPERRGDPALADVRLPRVGLDPQPRSAASDWLFSLQVTKTLPLDGRLSVFAFNALDRVGRYATAGRGARLYSPLRYGVEMTLPLGMLPDLWR
ncbi:MAG: hypothetical protein NVS3B18_16800 [Candidatus Dormibacteria bacterium]